MKRKLAALAIAAAILSILFGTGRANAGGSDSHCLTANSQGIVINDVSEFRGAMWLVNAHVENSAVSWAVAQDFLVTSVAVKSGKTTRPQAATASGRIKLGGRDLALICAAPIMHQPTSQVNSTAITPPVPNDARHAKLLAIIDQAKQLSATAMSNPGKVSRMMPKLAEDFNTEVNRLVADPTATPTQRDADDHLGTLYFYYGGGLG